MCLTCSCRSPDANAPKSAPPPRSWSRDSIRLSLTQVAFAIRKEFSAKVSFSQLMNQWPNVDMLAAHLDATLPPDILAEAPAVPAPLPVTPLPAAPPLRMSGRMYERNEQRARRSCCRASAHHCPSGCASRKSRHESSSAIRLPPRPVLRTRTAQRRRSVETGLPASPARMKLNLRFRSAASLLPRVFPNVCRPPTTNP